MSELGLERAGFIHDRVLATDLSIRSGGDGRTIYGTVVPFDCPTEVNDGRGPYLESFKRGSFARTIGGGAGNKVKLMGNHDKRRFPLGRATMLREEGHGLVGEFHVSATQDGEEALALVRDGVLDSFSVGFVPVRHERVNGVVERVEVALREVSVVAFPAYQGATIAGVRDQGQFPKDVDCSPAARRERLTVMRNRWI